jgi:hypothetical protein
MRLTLISRDTLTHKNNRYCSSENPHPHIIGLIFYEETLDAECYINEILDQFFVNLASAEERFDYFMHTLKETV